MTEMTRTPHYSDEANLDELLAQLNPNYADLILVEGFKSAHIPKIEVHRANSNLPLLADIDKDIIAVATDVKLDLATPILDLNNISAIADFIILEILNINSPLP